MIAYSKRWKFRSYCSENGDEIRDWYEQQTPSVQAELTVVVAHLQPLDVKSWNDSDRDYKDLQDKLLPLGELRIIVEKDTGKEHYRILGFMDEIRWEFTMLFAGRKTRKFDFYKRHGPTALTRKSEIESNRARFSCSADWMLLP